MAFLELTHVRKVYPGATAAAVEDFNLAVAPGEFVSFLGPSGCGKTTTLRMVAGFETPTGGAIVMDGKEITQMRPNQRNIGMVFQSYALFPNMTVADNIGFGLSVGGVDKAQIRQRIEEMLALIKLEQLGGRFPYQLSGGQQQRVALARAIAIRPKLLLLDEPLSALDAKIRVSLRNEIRAIQRQLGITTIYVTHDQEEALSLSDRVVVMNHGVIEQVGAPFEIYNFPSSKFAATFVGTLNMLPVIVVDAEAGILKAGEITIRTAPQLANVRSGEDANLALRPESVRFTGAASGSDNQLVGEVETVNFLGSVVRMLVRVQGHLIALDEFNHPTLQLPGVESRVTAGRQTKTGLRGKARSFGSWSANKPRAARRLLDEFHNSVELLIAVVKAGRLAGLPLTR
jgi:putative spermidine/putrescine transport system ATP-binding protein